MIFLPFGVCVKDFDQCLADQTLLVTAGGQKVKVVLAAAMWNNPHILVLDVLMITHNSGVHILPSLPVLPFSAKAVFTLSSGLNPKHFKAIPARGPCLIV